MLEKVIFGVQIIMSEALEDIRQLWFFEEAAEETKNYGCLSLS